MYTTRSLGVSKDQQKKNIPTRWTTTQENRNGYLTKQQTNLVNLPLIINNGYTNSLGRKNILFTNKMDNNTRKSQWILN